MARTKQTDSSGYQTLKSELKAGVFRRMYVFYGEEDYLRENYRKQLRNKLVSGPAEEFNYHRFTEENWSLEAISEAVEAVPMMSEYSLVEISDVNLFQRPDSERTQLSELLTELPDYCVLLLIYDALEWKPDKRIKKLWEPISRQALEVDFPRQPESQLLPWIRRHLATGKKAMRDDLARYLILQTGGSMTVLAAELQKLMSYTDQQEITRNDIDAVVIPVMEAAVFDITGDLGRKDFEGALEKLRNLLRQDTEPIVINAVIGRQLRQLYGAKILSDHGKGPFDLAKLYGIRDFAAREVYQQARGFQKSVLRQAILLSSRTDYAMKTSGGDAAELLEMMVLRLGALSGGTR